MQTLRPVPDHSQNLHFDKVPHSSHHGMALAAALEVHNRGPGKAALLKMHHLFHCRGMGLIPGQGTMIPRAVGSKKEKKKWGPGGQGALNIVQGYFSLTDPVSMFF